MVIRFPLFIKQIEIAKKSRKTGKPRYQRINGQRLYSGIHFTTRSKMVREFKKYLYEYIRNLPYLSEYPLEIRYHIYTADTNFDLGNLMGFWQKCFEDALCGNVEFIKAKSDKNKTVYLPDREAYPAKIEDDSVKHISKYSVEYHWIENDEQRYIEIEILRT